MISDLDRSSVGNFFVNLPFHFLDQYSPEDLLLKCLLILIRWLQKGIDSSQTEALIVEVLQLKWKIT